MSSVNLHPYLFFTGNCAEAMEFYKSIFGGELTIQKHDDLPGETPEAMKGKTMHAELDGGEITLFASDGTRTTPYETSCISLH